MSMQLTVLGCGSSGGVPRIGNKWGACDPENPKNRRRRCAVLVERFGPNGRTRVLVDTPCDIREQLLDADVERVDAVLFTHDHADHTHGIDDLRVLAYNDRHRVPVYFDAATRESLLTRFGYCFSQPKGSSYPPILVPHDLHAGELVGIKGNGGVIEVLPILQDHGDMSSLGFRFGNVAYSPDISGIPASSVKLFEGLDVWIVDALRYTPHPSHFAVHQALDAIELLTPKRAILTHLHIDLDYEALSAELPAGVEAAYDGMTIAFEPRADLA